MQGDRPRRGLGAVLLVAALAAVWGPTLHWLQFCNSIENIVVETALETRREGRWLIPRMLDEPRTRKPPLAVWASALTARGQTVRELSDRAKRDEAYVRLAREMRLPALIAACLTILATFELGRVLGGTRVGVVGAAIAATSLLFLEYARLATPDTHLMLWVAACNVMLARAVIGGQRWLGFCGAGLCLGLAMMSKGPVALLQTVVPVAIFVLWRRWSGSPVGERRANLAFPALAGFALFLCIALPWPVLMMAEVPGVWRTWFAEVSRIDAADPRPEPWYLSLHIFRHLLPWTLWLVLGLVAAVVALRRREHQPAELAFWLLVLPLVVFSFFPERKPRYLQPVIPAAAVLAGWALVHVMREATPRWRITAAILTHYFLAAGMVIGTAITGVQKFRTTDGSPWFSWPVAAALSGTAVAIVLIGLVLRRFRERALVGATIAAMLLFDVMYLYGLSRSEAGRSDMKPLADAIVRRAPGAEVWSLYPGDPDRNAPLDLSIYLNRVVKPIASTDATAAGQVIVMPTADPPADARAWQHIGAAKRGAVTWHAFLVPVTSAETP